MVISTDYSKTKPVTIHAEPLRSVLVSGDYNIAKAVKYTSEIVTNDIMLNGSQDETISVLTEDEQVDNLIEYGTVMFTSAQLNIREEASVESKILGKLRPYTSVEVLKDCGNGWVEINYQGWQAFISSEYLIDEMPLTKVSSTAYSDEDIYTNASGRPLQVGYSVAGKIAWLGRSINVWKSNEDGSVGEFMGVYRFDDTGYGAESGVGQSIILEGRTIGTIENGTCIDFFMDNEEVCLQYGRHDVYIQFID